MVSLLRLEMNKRHCICHDPGLRCGQCAQLTGPPAEYDVLQAEVPLHETLLWAPQCKKLPLIGGVLNIKSTMHACQRVTEHRPGLTVMPMQLCSIALLDRALP